jgi:hypothetical protein
LDDFKMLSAKLVDVACDMKVKGEGDWMGKRDVPLSHYELCQIIDAITLVEAVRAVAPKGRQ